LNREASTQINRAEDFTIRWAAGGYEAGDVMTVTLSSAATLGGRAGALSCRAPASAGMLTIPSALLGSLSRVPVAALDLRLAPRAENRVRFALPLSSGGEDKAVFEYLYTERRRVELR
jgi:hypothetical protein